jgi:hypothetical protein
MPEERRATAEMLGEFLRDVAVLVLVFYPIETTSNPLMIVLASAVCLTFGVIIERRRIL